MYNLVAPDSAKFGQTPIEYIFIEYFISEKIPANPIC